MDDAFQKRHGLSRFRDACLHFIDASRRMLYARAEPPCPGLSMNRANILRPLLPFPSWGARVGCP